MPTNFLAMRRMRRCTAAHASDFGAERPYRPSGRGHSLAYCAALERFLISEKSLRRCDLITVRPIARSTEHLVRDIERVMNRFAYRWVRRRDRGHEADPDCPTL